MKWEKRQIPHEQYDLFINAGYNNIVSTVLCNAGINSLDAAKEFLSAGTLYDTNLLPDIDKVSEIVYHHIYAETPICIFGDYDADGVTSSAILYMALKQLKANVSVRLPDRINEGYGISIKAIKEQMEKGIKLFITVDNGIRAIEEVKYAREHGAQVIVLDHHQPGDEIPETDALIDLHIPNDSYPEVHLTGAGLAWKVAYHLLNMQGYADYAMSLIDLAAIGTIADVETLQGENRAIVKRALNYMHSKEYNRLGVKFLYKDDIAHITAEDIAFRVAPCINAAGRLLENGANKPFALLICNEMKPCVEMAKELIEINSQRKTIQALHYEKILDEAKECVKNGDKFLAIYAEGAPSGVVGLIAGNLREEFNRPAIVFSAKKSISGETVWTGSARSIPEINIIDVLTQTQNNIHCFLGYGGHAQAAGMTIPADKESFLKMRKELNRITGTIVSDEVLMPHPCYDLEITEDELNDKLIKKLDALEPFGVGCPKPIFKMPAQLISKNSKLYERVGEKHLKLFTKRVSILGFDMLKRYEDDKTPREITCYGSPSVNFYGGKMSIQFLINDYEFEKIERPKTPLMQALSSIEI